MAFNRILKVTLGTAEEALDFSNLVIGFRIKRSNIFSDNSAELNIYNVARETERKLMALESASLIVEAGYQDETEGVGQVAQIFVGNTSDIRPGDKFGADRILKIKATTQRAKSFTKKENKKQSFATVYKKERRQVYSQTYISQSHAPNAKLADVIKEIGNALGIVVNNLGTIRSIQLPNGWCFTGTVRRAFVNLDLILYGYGYGLTMDLNEINIYPLDGSPSIQQIAYLTKDNGLLHVGAAQAYQHDPKKPEGFPPKQIWELQTILLPGVYPSAIIQVKDNDFDGLGLVESIEHFGDNAGREFNSTIRMGTR